MTSKHICNKEAEIAEMHNDIKWIRRALEGNGTPGLIKQVNNNTKFRIEGMAGRSLAKLAISGGLITALASLALQFIN